MKKNILFFLMCTFAILGMTQAQNRGEIQLKTIEANHVAIPQEKLPSVGSWFSYVGDYSSPQIIGIGMPFNWGYMNVLGQVIYDNHVDGNMTILDMSSYQAGVYMVRVTTENGESVKLVSKQ